MKILFVQLLFFFKNKQAKRNVTLLLRFLFFLTLIVTAYSVIFHLIMVYEGRNFSWITGFYWTLTVMSTLGFGDITFATDLGLLFTLLVLLSGIILLLIMLPFTFIQFFYAPWLEAQNHSRTPRSLSKNTSNHIILTNYDSLTRNLVEKLKKQQLDYTFVCGDQQTALEIYDTGYKVVLGDVEHPDTYRKLQAHQAALLVTTADDLTNTNISFTVREVSETVPIACSADREHSLDILNFPGNTHVFPFMSMLGKNLAARAVGVTTPHIIERFEDLRIAELPVRDTILEGKSIARSHVRETINITIIGLWEKGKFISPTPDTLLNPTNILIMAGTEEEIKEAGIKLAKDAEKINNHLVLILGGGRVGQAAADFLQNNDIPYKVIEKQANLSRNPHRHIHGDAADINTLKAAGIDKARSVIITTHNDAMNIYLSFYCRQLRPDMQIISRATKELTISKLHRAGADLILSSSAMGARYIMNLLHPSDESFFSEALNIFTVTAPESFAGKSLVELGLRRKTGCSLLAIKKDSHFHTNPDPHTALPRGGKLILAGSAESEETFKKEYLE